jgi:hypothetical protein
VEDIIVRSRCPEVQNIVKSTLPPVNRGYLVGNVGLVGRVSVVGSREAYAKIMWQR